MGNFHKKKKKMFAQVSQLPEQDDYQERKLLKCERSVRILQAVLGMSL